MKSSKKVLSILLAGVMALSTAACSGNGKNSSSAGPASGSSANANNPDNSGTSDFGTLKLGDHKDVKASLKVITNRTDIVDTKLKGYVTEFQKDYPNVNITYESITDYDKTMTTRLTTKNWGDICMIPSTVKNSEFGDHFISFGKVDSLKGTYNFTTAKAYDGECYGIADFGNVEGIVYNKKVFADAGITSIPKTPDEFLKALNDIKTKSDGKVIPLYTNFHAGWTLGKWDDAIGIPATGDADFMNIKLAKMKNPFAKSAFPAGTGPYAVWDTLYEAVKQKLVEADPTTSDWESSKPKMNNGQIGTMVLGSWAVSQMQGAGSHKDDVSFMPFPITVNGKQYSSMGADYCYGINVNSSKDNQLASMLYVKWLTEKSNFASSEGGVSAVKGAALPDSLSAFKDVTLLEDTPSKSGEEDVYTNVNNDSKLSISGDNGARGQAIVEAAMKGSKTMDQIADEYNRAWSDAQAKNNVQAQ